MLLVLVLDFRAAEIGTTGVLDFIDGIGLGCLWI
jgi:hypothetical protein